MLSWLSLGQGSKAENEITQWKKISLSFFFIRKYRHDQHFQGSMKNNMIVCRFTEYIFVESYQSILEYQTPW